MRLVKTFLPAFLYFVANTVNAQNFGPSSYSRLGIGNMTEFSFSRNQGMGNAGVGLSHNYQLNTLNPAALAALKYTNFEFGIAAKNNVQRTKDDSQRGTSGAIQYFSLSLPVHKNFVTQFAARPFSSVNYSDAFENKIGEKAFQTTLAGSGGLSEFSWGNAYNYKDWLMLGLNSGLVLGQGIYEKVVLEPGVARYTTTRQRDEKHFRFSPGILITKEFKRLPAVVEAKIDSLKKDSILNVKADEVAPAKWFLGFGIAGDFYSSLGVNEDQYFNEARYDSYYGYTTYKIDTITSGPVYGYKMPNSMKVGLSLSKQNQLTLALDYTMSDWSAYSYNEINSTYRKQQVIALGGEFVPDYNSTKFYKRIAYRAGLNYNMLPYIVAGQNINQIQANVGAGIILPKTGVTINSTLTYGQKGTTNANLVKENYWMVSFGIIANTKWFIRRKHE